MLERGAAALAITPGAAAHFDSLNQTFARTQFAPFARKKIVIHFY
ncbi:hypothetical protein [Paraburkholderia guartelaensis]|nr:hypothetical protein [Paraburkholderia guartelaensis]